MYIARTKTTKIALCWEFLLRKWILVAFVTNEQPNVVTDRFIYFAKVTRTLLRFPSQRLVTLNAHNEI